MNRARKADGEAIEQRCPFHVIFTARELLESAGRVATISDEA